jgi:creatinine amidohydrolase
MRAAIRFLLCLCFASSALAQAPRSVFLEDLTWTEVRDAARAGAATIIVPIGGTEQSGPHIALGKHNARASFLAGRIAEKLGNTLVAPVIAYVPEGSTFPPAGHMRFPGTISIPESAFQQTLEGAGRSFRAHGFRDVVFIGDHGGYRTSMKKAADVLNREWAGTPHRAHAIDEYYRAADFEFAKALREKSGLTADEIGTHGGAADTSLTLAVDPRLVRADRPDSPDKTRGFDGDPSRGSAELGKMGVDLIVERTVAAIRKATAPR